VRKGLEDMRKSRVVTYKEVVKRLKRAGRVRMIEWREQVTRHLDQAHDYITLSNSDEVAAGIAMHIAKSVQQLATFPMSGRPARVPGTRELVISNSPFVVACSIKKERIVILTIYHGAQQWPEAF
jgi:toxin ParE1/3/4